MSNTDNININFPKAMKYFKNCLSLPMYAGLTEKKQKIIINFLKKTFL